MKTLFSAFFLILAASVSMFSQTAPAAPELTKLLNEFLEGAGRNDAAIHDRFWADDLIYTRSTGVRTTKLEMMKGLRAAQPPKSTDPVTVYTAEDVQIHQYGNTAVVAFKLVSTTTKSDGSKTVGNNLNTGTFVKRKGVWQAVAWQSTIVPKTDTASRSSLQTGAGNAKPAAFAATSAAGSSSTSDENHTYQKGSKGGCYYLNTLGKKVYVNHDLCK